MLPSQILPVGWEKKRDRGRKRENITRGGATTPNVNTTTNTQKTRETNGPILRGGPYNKGRINHKYTPGRNQNAIAYII